jgi:pheromone a factor receptor
MSYPNFVYSIFSFIGFLLVVIPLPWHLEAWNTGTCLYMIWCGMTCLIFFINSVVWNGNALNPAPRWCDFSTHFIVGANAGIPAASLCINRRLYYISRCSSVTVTKKQKRRAIYVDLAIGVGIPLIAILFQYTVEGHRFNVFEDIGCMPFTYNVWPSFILVTSVPICIGLVSLVYCILSITAFAKRQAQFKKFLSANNNLTSGRYIRLMCLAGADAFCTVPLAAFIMWSDIHTFTIWPYEGWANVHWGFSQVDQIPSLVWRSYRPVLISLEMGRWIPIGCAFTFFIFFGFADEARKNYRMLFTSVAKRVGYTFPSTESGMSASKGPKTSMPFMVTLSGKGLPVFVKKESTATRDSMASFSLTIPDVGGLLDDTKAPVYSPTESGMSTSRTTLPPQLNLEKPLPDIQIEEITRPEPALDSSSIRHSARLSLSSRPASQILPTISVSEVSPPPSRPTSQILPATSISGVSPPSWPTSQVFPTITISELSPPPSRPISLATSLTPTTNDIVIEVDGDIV